jgi:predicted small integral membrane protein
MTLPLRLSKIALILGIAIYYTIVVFNNLADHNSNLQVVRQVLLMDTTFPANRLMWRALPNPRWHAAFYLAIIAWEGLTTILCWWGGCRLARAVRSSAGAFR